MKMLAHEINIFKTSEFFKKLKPLFTKPQYPHFINFISGLIGSEAKQVSSISHSLVKGVDQSTMNRFLNSSDWDPILVKDRILGILDRDKRTATNKSGLLIIDDSILEKTPGKIEGIGNFYKISEKRFVWGHNKVSLHYSDAVKDYPLDFFFYFKEKDFRANKIPADFTFQTKIDLAVKLLEENAPKTGAQTLVFDSWYFSKKIAEIASQLGLSWVTRAKQNRFVKYNREWLPLKALIPRLQEKTWKKIPFKARLDEKDKRYQYMLELVVKMRRVGRIKLVVVKNRLEDNAGIFLVSDNLDFSAKKIIQIYSKRWDVEVFYRSAKAHLGLGKYMLRNLKGIIKYSYLVFFSAIFLEWSKLMGHLSQYKKEVSTLGEKAKAFKEKFLEGIIKWANLLYSKALNFSLAFKILRNAKL